MYDPSAYLPESMIHYCGVAILYGGNSPFAGRPPLPEYLPTVLPGRVGRRPVAFYFGTSGQFGPPPPEEEEEPPPEEPPG